MDKIIVSDEEYKNNIENQDQITIENVFEKTSDYFSNLFNTTFNITSEKLYTYLAIAFIIYLIIKKIWCLYYS